MTATNLPGGVPGAWRRSGPPPEASTERLYWRSVSKGFLIVFLVIAIAGFAVYRAARDSVTHAVTHNLEVIANLKATHLDHWLDEEQYDLWTVMRAELAKPEFADTFRKWLQGGMRDDVLQAGLRGDLRRISEAHRYLEINFRSGQDGSLLLSSDGDVETAASRDSALGRIRNGEPILGDFHIGVTDSVPKLRFGFLNALSIGGNPQDVVVVEVMLDASEAMFPATQQWPGWNISAQTRLLRRDGNKVVVLNSPNRISKNALFSGFSTEPLADSIHAGAIQAGTGALQGNDAHNQPIFAYALPVPHTPWTLVAEVSKGEAYAKLNTIAAMATAIVVSLMLTSGWWLRQQSRNTIARVRIEAERKLLTTRINFLAKYANDCIILIDASGRIMEVNDRCPRTYGYSRDELLQMSLSDLHTARNRSELPQLLRQIPEDGLIHESEHERKGGTPFDVEMSTSLINIDGKRFYQAIIRDISERKRHQMEREAHMQLLNELTCRLVNVQEEERRHLSGELHDQVGANLATINLNLRRISKMSPVPDPQRLKGLLTETGSLLADTISSIRDYCADLRPAILDYSGLVPALEELVQRFGRHCDIVTHLRQENLQERLPPQIESMLFRIVQEALTNCAKHSNAATIEVAVSQQDRKVVLTVADDGNGFDPLQLGTHQMGMGLLTMSERAAMMGGKLSIISGTGKGTRIMVTVEIQEDTTSKMAVELPRSHQAAS